MGLRLYCLFAPIRTEFVPSADRLENKSRNAIKNNLVQRQQMGPGIEAMQELYSDVLAERPGQTIYDPPIVKTLLVLDDESKRDECRSSHQS